MTDGPQLAALLEVLDRHGVDVVVAGSVGALAHGAEVDPGDLDIVPAIEPANLERLAAALGELDAEPVPETGAWVTGADGEHCWVEDGVERVPRPLDPTDPGTFDHSFRTPLGRLDVVPSVVGSHADLRPRAVWLPVAGRQAWVAHAVDLLAAMTAARRPKDAPRVRHLRKAVSVTPAGSGVGFVGFRTDRFGEIVALFRDRIGLHVIQERPGATRFRLGHDAELHVYADSDPDHAFFSTGPVVGLRVDDVDSTRAAMEADGLEMLTEVERTGTAAWCHLRAPDGTVLEIIGPAEPSQR